MACGTRRAKSRGHGRLSGPPLAEDGASPLDWRHGATREAVRLITSAAGEHGLAEGEAAVDEPLVIDWRPVVADLVGDLLAGRPVEGLAASFHHAVARMIDAVSERLTPAASLGLSGGVFQNALLVERTLARCHRRGRGLLLHHTAPPSDGGLALGQAVLARRRLG